MADYVTFHWQGFPALPVISEGNASPTSRSVFSWSSPAKINRLFRNFVCWLMTDSSEYSSCDKLFFFFLLLTFSLQFLNLMQHLILIIHCLVLPHFYRTPQLGLVLCIFRVPSDGEIQWCQGSHGQDELELVSGSRFWENLDRTGTGPSFFSVFRSQWDCEGSSFDHVTPYLWRNVAHLLGTGGGGAGTTTSPDSKSGLQTHLL